MSGLDIFPYPNFPREAPAKVKTNRAGLKALGGRLKWNFHMEHHHWIHWKQVCFYGSRCCGATRVSRQLVGCHRLWRVTVLCFFKRFYFTPSSGCVFGILISAHTFPSIPNCMSLCMPTKWWVSSWKPAVWHESCNPVGYCEDSTFWFHLQVGQWGIPHLLTQLQAQERL